MSNRYSASKLREIRALGSRYAPGHNFTRQWHPIYNISPKCDVPVVVNAKEQPLRLMRWGTWTAGGLLANELAETVASKPVWNNSVQHRRCLILSAGFFEWETMGPRKFARYFTVTVRDAFPMAGIWMPANDDQPERCIMVTTGPNEVIATFDDRMPAILSDWDAIEWLGDKPLAAGAVGRICQPYPAEKLSHWASPPEVSRTTFQDPSAIRPLPKNPSNN